MLRPRFIPCLLMDGGGLVKTRQFKEPKYVGDPINAVKIFNEKEVDELILLDITAWKKGGPSYGLLEKIAVESRMPLCYGGGVTKAAEALRIVNLGFEKVSVSSAAIANPVLVPAMADAIGSQSVVVTLDVGRDGADGYAVFVENGRKRAKTSLPELCQEFVKAGAGELVINSIDREGEMSGYDIALAKQLIATVPVPMTFIGGAGKPSDMAELIEAVGVVGAGAGSMFVFKGPFRAVLINYVRPTLKSRSA